MFPAEAVVVERNFYMDDLFKSVSSLTEARTLQVGLVKLLSYGGFRLTKWISNNKDFLKTIPEEERAQSVRNICEEGALPTEKALGVVWDVQYDKFIFKIKPKELADTRRKVVSLTASLFDPIGRVKSKDVLTNSVATSSRLGRRNTERLSTRMVALAKRSRRFT
jgi:hypothetical protein